MRATHACCYEHDEILPILQSIAFGPRAFFLAMQRGGLLL